MSVELSIDNPANNEEAAYIIPIASERIFKQVWQTAAIEYNLPLIEHISFCLDVDKNNVDQFLSELKQVLSCAEENTDPVMYQSISTRINRLLKKIPALMNKRSDIILTIG
ncbi:hypothetical protein [Zooshikella harenae]|uniref:Uncharacterized protein n=1 Tax=Zooshikella harenae TaxID=2827238 RepID=A0ABS5ZIQ6_9GAMM|nr:hypothetical protein [Zooshikella harenae]MBU2713959.1 hypothetical protein [Zooshikella harenae]